MIIIYVLLNMTLIINNLHKAFPRLVEMVIILLHYFNTNITLAAFKMLHC